MNKREFLKKSALLTVGGAAITSIPGNAAINTLKGNTGRIGKNKIRTETGIEYLLPDLEYPFDALEPYIDAMTMEIHHDKHHAAYTKNFNAAIQEAGIADMKIKDIFANVSKYTAGVRNNGGGYYNHKLYWKVMGPNGGGTPTGELLKAIETSFGSFDSFKEKFSNSAATRFGSGWAWLIHSDGKLVIASTPNQDNPLMDIAEVKGNPLLLIDVWEHAYYLKYQNRRADYIAAFWNVINWEFVSEKYLKATEV
jgi:superoxide dismutase, Fe-Mn family